jgi:hypothetical protein
MILINPIGYGVFIADLIEKLKTFGAFAYMVHSLIKYVIAINLKVYLHCNLYCILRFSIS